MKRFVIAWIVLLSLANSMAIGQESKDSKPAATKRQPKFTVGKDTTYVDGPLDKDGYIDYESALNQRLREGVTPENNANVLIFKAFGPYPDDAILPAEFFKWMQIAVPPRKGDYFVNMNQFARDHLRERRDEFNEDVDRAGARPWTAQDYPEVAAWLKLNEKPLAVMIEASKCTHYYYPLLGNRKHGKTEGLISAQTAGIQSCRSVAKALAARAMLRVAEKRHDDAWQDLLACHRLGRLVGRSGLLIGALAGNSVDRTACQADLAFLDAAGLDAKTAKKCLRDLQQLPALPALADCLQVTERMWFLECVMLVDRYGSSYLGSLNGTRFFDREDLLAKAIIAGVDLDPALRSANQTYNRMAQGMRLKDRDLREKHLSDIDFDLRELRVHLIFDENKVSTIFGAKSVAEGKGKLLGDMMIHSLAPGTRRVMQSSDRSAQTQRNLHVAFALAAYKSDMGHYPLKLEALAPKYLPSVPDDLFSGRPIIYLPADNRYLLYSVGINGEDEGGRGEDDDPPGDDLSVRMRPK